LKEKNILKMEEKYQNMLFDLLVAAIILLIIMLPRFCFRVNEKDYLKAKQEYEKNIQDQQLDELKKFLAEKSGKTE